MVSIIVEEGNVDEILTSLLVIGIFEDERSFSTLTDSNSKTLSLIMELIENHEFQATFGSNMILRTVDKKVPRKILLIGLGKKEKFTYDSARMIAGKAALKAREIRVEDLCILPFREVDEGLIEAISEGIFLSLYSFGRYKTSGKDEITRPSRATITVHSDSAKMQLIVDKVALITEAVN